ncbi:MAG TPA: HAD family hydrolase [Alphaproteobacteria bacterium]|jgi:phosphoglycolate phosphatase
MSPASLLTPPPPKPRAVLFDWDNTLVDSWPAIHASVNRTLAAMGHPTWSLEEAKRRIARSLRDSFPQLFGERWNEAREIYYRSFAEVHLDTLRPKEGALELIETLHERGCYLAVVSNKTGKYLRLEAERLGWNGHFRQLVGATDAARDKPAVEPVDMALADSGIARGPDVWFVGDGAVDLECARNAGLSGFLVGEPTGEPIPPEMLIPQASGGVWTVPDCAALGALVRGL